MKHLPLALVAATLTLSGCGGQSSQEGEQVSGDQVADKLDQAADQSAPIAKDVLETAAAEARGQESMAPIDQPGSFAQDAMQKAGSAEASASPAAQP